jgi:hypothetical protein
LAQRFAARTGSLPARREIEEVEKQIDLNISHRDNHPDRPADSVKTPMTLSVVKLEIEAPQMIGAPSALADCAAAFLARAFVAVSRVHPLRTNAFRTEVHDHITLLMDVEKFQMAVPARGVV